MFFHKFYFEQKRWYLRSYEPNKNLCICNTLNKMEISLTNTIQLFLLLEKNSSLNNNCEEYANKKEKNFDNHLKEYVKLTNKKKASIQHHIILKIALNLTEQLEIKKAISQEKPLVNDHKDFNSSLLIASWQ